MAGRAGQQAGACRGPLLRHRRYGDRPGDHVWDGILDNRADGACTRQFPLYGTSRTVAGGPIEGGVYACDRQPVRVAIARGLYGSWRPTDAERRRLEQIFPTGVCDYR
ncbi:DUF6351 family protein [Plantactinospora veratri]